MTNLALSETGLHTRHDLLYKVAGNVRARASFPKRDLPRRIWPDEPNVGFVEERMAFFIDGALKIGGPTLKTYDLNNDGTTGWTRETRLYHDDTYGKLRGSENSEPAADVFNAVGCWTTADSVGKGSDLTWDTEITTDASTYAFAGGAISILRPGVYHVSYRAYATPLVGLLRALLTVGARVFEWSGIGCPTTITIADTMTVVKTDTDPSAVTLGLLEGTALGDSGANLLSSLSVVKLR